MKKLPSKKLKEAARLYAIPRYIRDVDVTCLDEYPYDPVEEKAFIAGAEWQKEQKSAADEILPGAASDGIPGKDYIPVEWVEACERFGKWKIVRCDGVDIPKITMKE